MTDSSTKIAVASEDVQPGAVFLAETRPQRRARQIATALALAAEACESARFYVEQAQRAVSLAGRIQRTAAQEASGVPADTPAILRPYTASQRVVAAGVKPLPY
jgi:hypothetical protein